MKCKEEMPVMALSVYAAGAGWELQR